MSSTRDVSPAQLRKAVAFDVDLLPQALLVLDQQGFVRTVNQTWNRLYHHRAEQTVGRSFLDYIHPKDKLHTREALDQAWEEGITCNRVARILDGGNMDLWADIYFRPQSSDEDATLVVSISDISDRVGEERLLLAQHRSINSILNDLPGMVYRCRNNPEWSMEYVSEGCVELTGYRAEDIVHSRTLSYGSMIVDEDKESVWQGVQNALREHRRFELVYRIRTALNEVKWVWEKGKGIYSAEGELSGIEGIITDFCRQMLLSQSLDDFVSTETMIGAAGFVRKIEQRLDKGKLGGELRLFCIHLDRYERYMAGAGHEMLKAGHRYVASALSRIGHREDLIFSDQPNRWFVARFSGQDAPNPSVEAGHISDVFLDPIEVGDRQLYVSVSVGCAIVSSTGLEDVKLVMHEAVRAMNYCHETGGGSAEIVTI